MKLRKCLISLVVAAAMLFVGTAAFAQDSGEKRNALIPGEKTIAFGLPSGSNPYASGTAGMGYVVTENIVVGINLGLSLDSQTAKAIETSGTGDSISFDGKSSVSDDTNAQLGSGNKTRTSFDLLLAPNIKYYFGSDGNVLPYAFGQLNFQKFFDGDQTTTPSLKKSIEATGSDPSDQRNLNPQEQLGLAVVGGFGVDWFPVPRFSVGGHVGLGVDVIRPTAGLAGATNDNGERIITDRGLAFGTFTSSLNATFWF
jgi:hypothetical protein